MLSRRRFLSGASASVAALSRAGEPRGTLLSEPDNDCAAQHSLDPGGVSRYVDLMIGTGGQGHTYPGATVPFGMVQVGPDTDTAGWDHCSGYHHADESLMGFNHTHLSGTGCGDMLDVLLMPGVGSIRLELSSLDTPERGYRSRFAHARKSQCWATTASFCAIRMFR